MTATPSPAPVRDNLLGICHRLGATFGIDPLWLRIAFAMGLLANFALTVLCYLTMGAALVLAMLVTGEIAPWRRISRRARA